MENIKNIELKKLIKSPFNIRVEATTIGELAKNIKQNGLQQPIVVRPSKTKGKYEIVIGNRRVKAFETLGKKEIPSIVKELSDGEVVVQSLSENMMRNDVSPEEKARAFAIALGRNDLLGNLNCQLKKTYTERDLAKKLGITHQSVNQGLEPLKQTKETRELVKSKAITEITAKAIRQFAQDGKKEVKIAKTMASAEKKQEEALKIISDVKKTKGTSNDLIKKIKGEDKIKDKDIEKNKLSKNGKKTETKEETKEEDKDSVIGDVDLGDLETEKSVSVTITGDKLIGALERYAQDKKLSVDDAVIGAVKKELQKEGYEVD